MIAAIPPGPWTRHLGLTRAIRHTGVGVARRAGRDYVHGLRGVWLDWSKNRCCPRIIAGWECCGDGSGDVDLMPEGTTPTCPVCILLAQARGFGCPVGTRSVYYVERGGLIKIGRTLNVASRTRQLKGRLLAAEQAGPEVSEASRHQQFAHLRAHGEWFRPDSDLLAHITSLSEQAS